MSGLKPAYPHGAKHSPDGEDPIPGLEAGPPGPEGPPGATGATGAAGATGATGAAGPSNVIRESSGPTDLTVGAVADGQLLKRIGNTVVGVTLALTLALSGEPMLTPGGQQGSTDRST